jgi:energy-coupling factor transporter ATP-binding protein EcfA2
VSADDATRIAVLGCSGSGKSTLAAHLAGRLGLPYLATDHIFWTDDWRPTPSAEVRAWLAAAVAQERWVSDGNFDSDRDLLWTRAELIVWLDLPLTVVLAQVLRRNLAWWWRRTPIWGSERMTLPKAISGVGHVLRSHGAKHTIYPAWLAACGAKPVVRLRTKTELARWLGAVRQSG